jgi:hypothetical protein
MWLGISAPSGVSFMVGIRVCVQSIFLFDRVFIRGLSEFYVSQIVNCKSQNAN